MAQRIISGFPSSATAEDVISRIDMSGKRVLITGASSGIGL